MNHQHPYSELLRTERLPHIWCPGCGLGIALDTFCMAVQEMKMDLDKLAVISGIGCSGRIAGYLNVDSFHTTHGRAIPFATGLHLANPELNVVVFSGDGDLVGIGGNHLIHAARRNLNLKVFCVNNFIYGMTGGQMGPTTPQGAISATSPFGNIEYAFNLPHLAASCGAVYVARWTVLDIVKLKKSMQEALNKKGFSFIEIISPCPTLYGRFNNQNTGVEMMRYFKTHTVHNPKANLAEIEISNGGQIVVGKFLDIERPTFRELYHQGVEERVRKTLEEKYEEKEFSQEHS